MAPVAQPQSDPLTAMSASDPDFPLPPLKPLHIPLMDLPSVDIFSHFATTREFISAALRDEGARVLVCVFLILLFVFVLLHPCFLLFLSTLP